MFCRTLKLPSWSSAQKKDEFAVVYKSGIVPASA